MKEKILVSACLMGAPCRYDGTAKASPAALRLAERYEIVRVCPEALGGLPTPREPSELRGERVFMRSGRDVTGEYRRGAERALELCRKYDIRTAVLKERSPSCGLGEIFDGTFRQVRIPGSGVTARLLAENGIRVLGESEIAAELLR